ncbi:MAG: hypothetical protein Q9180_002543 [Flavoplaca navasiana]
MASVNQKAINLWTARVIPVVLAGIVGYATWVIVVLVCIDYLLKPSPTLGKPRPGAGIAILTIYASLLLILALTYFRLLYTVIANPGYTPRGPQWHQQNSSKRKNRRSNRTVEPPPDLEKQNGSLGDQSTSNGTLSVLHEIPGYMTSTNGMYSLARVTVDQPGVQRASIGSWTEPITAAK